jgi:hypothetical protein
MKSASPKDYSINVPSTNPDDHPEPQYQDSSSFPHANRVWPHRMKHETSSHTASARKGSRPAMLRLSSLAAALAETRKALRTIARIVSTYDAEAAEGTDN